MGVPLGGLFLHLLGYFSDVIFDVKTVGKLVVLVERDLKKVKNTKNTHNNITR